MVDGNRPLGRIYGHRALVSSLPEYYFGPLPPADFSLNIARACLLVERYYAVAATCGSWKASRIGYFSDMYMNLDVKCN